MKDKILVMINELFSDVSKTSEKTLEDLNEILEELEIKIEALNFDNKE